MKCVRYMFLAAFVMYSSHMMLDYKPLLNWLMSIEWLGRYVEYILPGKAVYSVKLLYGFMVRFEIKLFGLLVMILVASLVPYIAIGKKLIAYLFVLFFIKEVLYFAIEGNQHYSSDLITIGLFLTLVTISLLYSSKWDRDDSVNPDKDKHMGYSCYKKPKNFVTFLASLVSFGGSRATLHRDVLFKVDSKGVVRKVTFLSHMKEKYYFVPFFVGDDELINRGNTLVGRKITLFKNCFSVMKEIEKPYK